MIGLCVFSICLRRKTEQVTEVDHCPHFSCHGPWLRNNCISTHGALGLVVQSSWLLVVLLALYVSCELLTSENYVSEDTKGLALKLDFYVF